MAGPENRLYFSPTSLSHPDLAFFLYSFTENSPPPELFLDFAEASVFDHPM